MALLFPDTTEYSNSSSWTSAKFTSYVPAPQPSRIHSTQCQWINLPKTLLWYHSPAPSCNGPESQVPTLASKLLSNLAHHSLHTLRNLTKIKDSFLYTTAIFSFPHLVWAIAFSLYFQCLNLTNPSMSLLAMSSLKFSITLPVSSHCSPLWIHSSHHVSFFLDTYHSQLGSFVYMPVSLIACCKTKSVFFFILWKEGRRGAREGRSFASNLTS